ncbi:hypothetical protein F0231_09480 [Vibrio sp. RE86]|nr:hypothetical protein [Vibrio sp. RE86]
MNNPSTYLLYLGIAILILIAVNSVLPQPKDNIETTGVVLASTLTQSLDGHRKYLSVQTSKSDVFRVSIPISIHCEVGKNVQLLGNTRSLETTTSFQFISCD